MDDFFPSVQKLIDAADLLCFKAKSLFPDVQIQFGFR